VRALARRGAVTTSGIASERLSAFFSVTVFASEQRGPSVEADAQATNTSRPTHEAIDSPSLRCPHRGVAPHSSKHQRSELMPILSRTKDPTMLVLMALIRALHEEGMLPAQAIADVLDRRALNAALRRKVSEDETAVQRTAVALQELADDIERSHSFRKQVPSRTRK
jgi:hypothetical protein